MNWREYLPKLMQLFQSLMRERQRMTATASSCSSINVSHIVR